MQKQAGHSLLLFFLVFFFTGFYSISAQSIHLGSKLMSKMISDTTYTISKNVTETDLHYLNAEGDPMAVSIIKAKLKKGKLMLEATSPFNKDTFARQTVMQQMKYAKEPNSRVIVGVNAGFFNMKTGAPITVEMKDGKIISGKVIQKRGFAGVLKSEKLIIGKSGLYLQNKDRLEEALGAYPLLVKDGKVLPQKHNSFSLTRHPRTALGIIDKRTVLFVVVDGRQPDYSNGMPLEELALLMKALDAKTAINLDGGGSSTMISLDEQTEKLKLRNQPSGDRPRAVANAWILVLKE